MSHADFEQWLYENHCRLREYKAWEIARLAFACGFSMADIAPRLTDWIAISRRKLKLWDSPFFEQWVSLWAYETTGKLWDEIKNKGDK